MRAQLVINPHSRRGRESGDAVRAALKQHGVEVSESAGADNVDAIIVAGGDGTFARTIESALQRNVPIGLVPLGTFNDLARTLDIPFEIEPSCAIIASGLTRAIDVARVNGVHYVTEASIGLSSRLTRLQKPGDKQRFGVLAIVASAFAAVKYFRPFGAQVSYNDAHDAFRTVQLTIANSHHFGGFITVEGAAIDDGWLDLYSVEIERFYQIFPVLKALLSGKPRSTEGLRTYRSREFSVTTRRPHRITADGEPAGVTPARFEILPARCAYSFQQRNTVSKRAAASENFPLLGAYIGQRYHG